MKDIDTQEDSSTCRPEANTGAGLQHSTATPRKPLQHLNRLNWASGQTSTTAFQHKVI